jgi:cold shock CspA family protein
LSSSSALKRASVSSVAKDGQDGVDTFVHITNCVDGKMPVEGDVLLYDVGPSAKKPGQTAALNVTGGSAKQTSEERAAGGSRDKMKDNMKQTVVEIKKDLQVFMEATRADMADLKRRLEESVLNIDNKLSNTEAMLQGIQDGASVRDAAVTDLKMHLKESALNIATKVYNIEAALQEVKNTTGQLHASTVQAATVAYASAKQVEELEENVREVVRIKTKLDDIMSMAKLAERLDEFEKVTRPLIEEAALEVLRKRMLSERGEERRRNRNAAKDAAKVVGVVKECTTAVFAARNTLTTTCSDEARGSPPCSDEARESSPCSNEARN